MHSAFHNSVFTFKTHDNNVNRISLPMAGFSYKKAEAANAISEMDSKRIVSLFLALCEDVKVRAVAKLSRRDQILTLR